MIFFIVYLLCGVSTPAIGAEITTSAVMTADMINALVSSSRRLTSADNFAQQSGVVSATIRKVGSSVTVELLGKSNVVRHDQFPAITIKGRIASSEISNCVLLDSDTTTAVVSAITRFEQSSGKGEADAPGLSSGSLVSFVERTSSVIVNVSVPYLRQPNTIDGCGPKDKAYVVKRGTFEVREVKPICD